MMAPTSPSAHPTIYALVHLDIVRGQHLSQ
jgi:hypothetical protein